MPAAISVIIPVLNGGRYLEEVLNAVDAQHTAAPVEVVMVDSGSTDGSVEIARAAGARVLEIEPAGFGHGRTRNLAAEHAEGDVLAFLTQDATPGDEHWLAALTAPLDAAARVGLSFGPHLPRPDTSPMIARELTEFFASFSPAGEVRLDGRPDPRDPAAGFFSNVNSCVLRECWEQVRFRDIEYAEDQAFARDAMAAGWTKAYVPAAGVLHAHDYPFAQFMRRYFDEYRGLRETVGHVEPIRPGGLARTTRRQVAADLGFMRSAGRPRRERVSWSLRSARHHAGRAVFSALGSRSGRLPGRVQRQLSLEGRAAPAGEATLPRVAPRGRYGWADVLEYERHGQAALATPSPHDGQRPLMHIAWVIPPFRRGSGGHMALFRLALELERRGHSNSVWIHDHANLMDRRVALAHHEVVEHFAPLRAGVFNDFGDWRGADVAFATGWQTAYPVARLAGCKLKSYLVQDYEPDFYPASAERLWAERTYRMGYPCLASSPWLMELLRSRYGAQAEQFDYGADFDLYRPLDVAREPDTVLFYARPATPRRATELGMLALAELLERRPRTRVVVFGDRDPPAAPFEYEFAGVRPPAQLADLYNRATIGVVISLTNYSLVPKEMMACGLPVVDVQGASSESVFGRTGEAIVLAKPDPLALAEAMARLLDDAELRSATAAAAARFVEGRTWAAAAETIEGHLRRWLAARWDAEREEADGAQDHRADPHDPESAARAARAHLT